MTDIPPVGYFTSAITNAQAKAAQDNVLAVAREALGGSAESVLTITGGSVTATSGCHSIDTEGGAPADDLANIAQTNTPDGRFLFIRVADASRVVTLKNMAGGGGQIALQGGIDHVLDSRAHWVLLKRTGTNWEEISRSGGSGTGTVVTGPFEATQAVTWSGIISPAMLTANQNDWNPVDASTSAPISQASTVRVTTDVAAGRTLTGIAGGAKGRIVKVACVGSYPLILGNQNSGSIAANRFAIGFDLTLYPFQSVDLTYDDVLSRWRVSAGFINGVAIGSGMDYWGPSPPPAGYAFPVGQNVSRTAYALAFAVLGTIYGAGDGSTTFGLFDKRGRHSIAKDDMGGSPANRVTTGGSGVNGTALGAAGGNETVTLTAAQSGLVNHAHTASFAGVGSYIQDGINIGIDFTAGVRAGPTVVAGTVTVNASGAANASAAHQNLSPGIVCNYIVFMGA